MATATKAATRRELGRLAVRAQRSPDAEIRRRKHSLAG
jgi:hypothetical protein